MVNLGINVIETNGTAAPALAPAPTSVAGLVMRTQRGPTNTAVRVSSFRQFTNRFGGYSRSFDGVGIYCVDGAFLNGLREAYIARVVGTGAVEASITLADRAGTSDPTLTIRAGYRGQADIGAWGNSLSISIADTPNSTTPGTFDLSVFQQRDTDPTPQVVETWEGVSLDPGSPSFVETLINNSSTGSAYIVVEAIEQEIFDPVVHTPAETSRDPLIGGNDGAPPVTADYGDAMERFDIRGIQLLAVPEALPAAELATVTGAGLDYCEGRGDCMFIGFPAVSQTLDAARTFGQGQQRAKAYGALYWPWIQVTDPIGMGANPTQAIPPVGHVLGAYARIEQTRGIWKAPAGNEAVLRGALAVEQEITDVDHTSLVKQGSVNGIRSIPGAGIVIDASRTLSTDTRWLFVNVRLLFNFVKASLRDGLRWVKQEPNHPDLWNQIKFNAITPFLLNLYQQGAFGLGSPADVFTVIVGPENNPPDQIALGNLTIEVYFYPSRPAETILIIVGQQESGATASDQ